MARKTQTEIADTKAQTLQLFQRWRATGDRRLRDQIFQLNLPLVHRAANRLAAKVPEPLDDLIQVGSIGLVKAIERFDPSQGNAFSSFACPLIQGELMHYERDRVVGGGLKLGRRLLEARPKVLRLAAAGETREAIAAATGLTVEEVAQVARSRPVTSLDSYRGESEDEGLEIAAREDPSEHWAKVAQALGYPVLRRQDGLIDATAICKAGGRRFCHYWQRQATKKYLENLRKRTGSLAFYQIQRGRRGRAWLADPLALDLIRWVDPSAACALDAFAVNSVIER